MKTEAPRERRRLRIADGEGVPLAMNRVLAAARGYSPGAALVDDERCEANPLYVLFASRMPLVRLPVAG